MLYTISDAFLSPLCSMPINVDLCDHLYLDINQSDLRRHTINSNRKFCYFQFNKNFSNHKRILYQVLSNQFYQYQAKSDAFSMFWLSEVVSYINMS